jgi:glycosyltransferase involved in cell wall biosynthesis
MTDESTARVRARVPEPLQLIKSAPEKSISVCHIVPAEMWAGAEAQIATLLEGLSREASLSICAIALGDGRIVAELEDCRIETKVIHQPSRRFWGCFREAAEFLWHRKIHILHSHKSKDNVLAFLLAKCLRVPHTIRTVHGLPEPATLKDRLVYTADRRTAPLSSRLIAVSADLRSCLSQDIAPSKIDVIHNAVDLQVVKSPLSKVDAKRRLGISPDAFVIGTAARLVPVKRLDLFLAVAELVSKQVSSLSVVIAGEGKEKARLQAQVSGKRLEKQVHFLGHRSDIYDVLRAMDLLLLTSDHEGLPTVVLEAMALGVPVVSRKVGGIPEVIDNDVNGILVDSDSPNEIAEASLRILRDASLYADLSLAGWQTVIKGYSARATVAEVTRIYQSLSQK